MAFPHGGTVGLVKGQLLRISVVHHEHGKSEFPPVPCVIVGRSPAPWRQSDVLADVFDAGGKLVASERFQDVKGHEAVFLDLPHPGGKLTARAAGRRASDRESYTGRAERRSSTRWSNR